MSEKRKPASDTESGGVVEKVARGAVAEVAGGVAGKIYWLLAGFLLAFAGMFLLIGWQFGPLVLVEAQQYKKFTSHVDARIVESWLALEFDAGSVRNPEFWRASTNASPCIVAEYDGDWGGPMRRGYCGTRVPLNDSYMLADLRDISPGVPFAWTKDEHGFVVPEMRMAPATKQWLIANVPDRFMHDKWPAKSALDWLRLELDLPVDDAIYGWTAPPAVIPLMYDPAKPAEALPAGIVKRRLDQYPNPAAMVVGFGIGLFVWFTGMRLIPLIQNLNPWGRWIVSALPLLTLPWWLDVFPQAMGHFSRNLGSVIADMVSDVNRTDRLIASEPTQATLATGERLVWRLQDSVYADTFGRFQFAQPIPRPVSIKAAMAVLTGKVTTQVRALDDAERAELFTKLAHAKEMGLKEMDQVFKPVATEVADDASASTASRRAAKHFLEIQ